MRATILELAKLGDFVQSTPLLAFFKEKKIDLSIVTAQKSVTEAAYLSGFSENVIQLTEEELKSGKCPKAQAETDILINLSLAPQVINFASSIKAGQILGPRYEGEKLYLPPGQKLVLAVMSLDRRLGLFNLVDMWRSLTFDLGLAPKKIFWPFKAENYLDLKGRLEEDDFLGLQLGCGHYQRRWPVEYFVDLAVRLYEEKKVKPVLFGSKNERALSLKFLKLFGDRLSEDLVANLCGQTSLSDLGYYLKKLKLLVTADTGVLHIAAALEVPTLSLFCGPAYAPETGPYANRQIIIQGLASCGPCAEGKGCARKNCQAMAPVETVFSLALTYFGQPLSTEAFKNLPRFLKIYQSAFDNFGLKLLPLEAETKTENYLLALSIREAGRAALYPAYEARLYPEEKWITDRNLKINKNKSRFILKHISLNTKKNK